MERCLHLLQDSIDEIEEIINGIEDMNEHASHKHPYYWTSDEIKHCVSQLLKKLLNVTSSESVPDLMEKEHVHLLQDSIDEIEEIINGIEDMNEHASHKHPYYWTSDEIKHRVSQLLKKLLNDE